MAHDRLLVVAQSPVLRFGIRGALDAVLDLGAVAEASGAIEAAAAAADARPNLIVIHDALPGVTGDLTAKMLRELRTGARIVILSDDDNDVQVVTAARLGADALLSTAIDPPGFAATVGRLVGKRRHEDRTRDPADRLLAETGVVESTDPDAPGSRLACALRLAAEEIAVLDGLARGLSIRETADRLRLQEQVAKTRVASLLQALGAADRATAIVTAGRLRLVNLGDQLPSPPPVRDLGYAPIA